MKPIALALIAGRLLAICGAALVLLALTWPWMTLRLSGGIGQPQEFRFTFSGSDITALAATDAALAPKLIDAIDEVTRVDPIARRDLGAIRDQLDQMKRGSAQILAWAAAIWIPPIVALMLALVLLVTNGELRYRRGIGAVLGLMALVSIVVLVATRLRIDGALAQIRAIPVLSDMFDSLDRAQIDITLRGERGIANAPFLAALLLLGGLVELILPLHIRATRTGIQQATPLNMPVLQTASAPIVEPAGERRSCVRCSKSLAAGAKFCNGCGARQD